MADLFEHAHIRTFSMHPGIIPTAISTMAEFAKDTGIYGNILLIELCLLTIADSGTCGWVEFVPSIAKSGLLERTIHSCKLGRG
jgi:hypothetical protein